MSEKDIGTVFAQVVGGLGNQLFIISTAIAYSNKYGKTLYCFLNPNETRQNHFGLPIGFPNAKIDHTYNEPCFSYKEIPYVNGNIMLNGYFQSSKYFPDKKIVNSITIPKSKDFSFPLIPDGKIPVCVHIRRGDYIDSSDFHIVPGNDYYSEAIKLMRMNVPNSHFLIFSDDIEYVKNNQIGDITKSEMTIVDQCDIDCINIMKECKFFIIANSTFSWWGAVLGGNKLVFAPKTWFGRVGPQDWQDIYEPDWIVI